MPSVSGLRSCYSVVGGLVYFGRMLDKIRLHEAGLLPADYHMNLGIGFDGRTCQFLGIGYEALKIRVLAGGCDEAILAWAYEQGGPKSNDDRYRWNCFMMKIGWRDDRTPVLRERIVSYGLRDSGKAIETFFDINEVDEDRDPVGSRSWELKEPRIFLLMGVSGSGKTTIGTLLSQTLGWRFTDADDFHPPANIAKMSAGIPLTDEDRAPWLAALKAHIDARLSAGENTVVACSALKKAYRNTLMADPGQVKLIYLRGSRELLHQRLLRRTGHFMKPAMLDSQIDALEVPFSALTVDIAQSPAEIVAFIQRTYGAGA
ncbi:MAG TPA: gluconokinase, GntK/IdnK-type [Rariglobus sp.]|jgi:gluconokinase|nr:gluconokinase, GntK/IdnK-type [Rariglobus sp.]